MANYTVTSNHVHLLVKDTGEDVIAQKRGKKGKELKKRWSYFIRKVYEANPLICPKCTGEMRIISFIDQPEVI